MYLFRLIFTERMPLPLCAVESLFRESQVIN